jgi:2-iminobutanoate/2-iminopropanoate deaminase
MQDYPVVNQIYARSFDTSPPARSTVEVSGLPKDVLIEIDVIAVA